MKNKEIEIELDAEDDDTSPHLLALYGDIDEAQCAELIYTLQVLKDLPRTKPFELIISTKGGDIDEMFSVYDAICAAREDREIHTIGMGKVMSAGVLLLAAGTRGHRKIGANCRVMIHNMALSFQGQMHDLKNEIESTAQTEKACIKSLVRETNLTKKELKKILNQKANVYLTANEAIKYGIADEIL